MADEQPKIDGSHGGQGASTPTAPTILPSESNTRRDLRMIERAVRQRWEIDDRAFRAMPGVMLAIAADATREDRSRIAAARVLVAMHGQNQDEAKPSGDLHLHQHNGEQVINDFSGLTNDQLRQYIELCELAKRSAGPTIVVGSSTEPGQA